MWKVGCYTCASALLMLVAQPCLAAEDHFGRTMSHRSSAGFAGAVFKLPLGHGTPKPNLRLQAGLTHSHRDTGSAAPASYHRATILEIGTMRSGEPVLTVGGQDIGQVQQRLGVNGSTGTTLLIVGGVLVAVVVLAVVAGGAGGDTCPTVEGRRDHCINP